MREKALDKLRKLLAQKMGEEDLGNFEAAAAFAAKVNELLIKHKIELSEVESAAEDKTNPFIYKQLDPEIWGQREKDFRVLETDCLAANIARANFCRVLCFSESNRIVFVGREMDVDISIMLYLRLVKLGLAYCEIELALTYSKYIDHYPLWIWENRGGNESFRFSFFEGFNQRIWERLEEKRRSLEGESTALVLADKAVDDFVVKEFDAKPDTGEERARKFIMQEAARAGFSYGNEVNLDPNALSKEAQSKTQGLINGI